LVAPDLLVAVVAGVVARTVTGIAVGICRTLVLVVAALTFLGKARMALREQLVVAVVAVVVAPVAALAVLGHWFWATAVAAVAVQHLEAELLAQVVHITVAEQAALAEQLGVGVVEMAALLRAVIAAVAVAVALLGVAAVLAVLALVQTGLVVALAIKTTIPLFREILIR
jgi:hypothetical protein